MKNNKHIIGIIGGMGPLATVELQRAIIAYTPATKDQEHISVITYNNVKIPDRTQSLVADNGTAFVSAIVASGKVLKKAGVTLLCMPCATAHARFEVIEKSLGVPMINMIEAVAETIIHDKKRPRPVAILATTGAIKECVYQKIFDQHKIPYIVPSAVLQKQLMDCIYAIKAGEYTESVETLQTVVTTLTDQGAGVVVLGCTELALCEELLETSATLINPLTILAQKIVASVW